MLESTFKPPEPCEGVLNYLSTNLLTTGENGMTEIEIVINNIDEIVRHIRTTKKKVDKPMTKRSYYFGTGLNDKRIYRNRVWL